MDSQGGENGPRASSVASGGTNGVQVEVRAEEVGPSPSHESRGVAVTCHRRADGGGGRLPLAIAMWRLFG